MKKKINLKHIMLFMVVFSVLLVGVSSVCAQNINATDNIVDLNNNNDMVKNPIIGEENETLENQNADNLTAAGTFDDFQSEINKAPTGSVLNLTRDYTGVSGHKIQFNKDLTIDGQGHTLGFGFCSICGKITLMNLKIINDYIDKNYNCGAIIIDGSAQYTMMALSYFILKYNV